MTQQLQGMQARIRQLEGSEGAISVKVDVEKCTGCGICVEACPVDAIRLDNDVAVIDEAACTVCGVCVDECPNDAIRLP